MGHLELDIRNSARAGPSLKLMLGYRNGNRCDLETDHS
jgi:hypothetical protein